MWPRSSLVVPASVAFVAFLHAQATGSLVDAAAVPASIAPFAEARAAAATAHSHETSPSTTDPSGPIVEVRFDGLFEALDPGNDARGRHARETEARERARVLGAERVSGGQEDTTVHRSL